MPIYTYDCEKCSTTVEHITSYAERDVPMGCLEPDYDGQGQCGGKLVRRGVELFTKGEPSFQTHAITTSAVTSRRIDSLPRASAGADDIDLFGLSKAERSR